MVQERDTRAGRMSRCRSSEQERDIGQGECVGAGALDQDTGAGGISKCRNGVQEQDAERGARAGHKSKENE